MSHMRQNLRSFLEFRSKLSSLVAHVNGVCLAGQMSQLNPKPTGSGHGWTLLVPTCLVSHRLVRSRNITEER